MASNGWKKGSGILGCRLSDLCGRTRSWRDDALEWNERVESMRDCDECDSDPFDGDDEEWRDIPGYPGYRASSLGRIFSKLTDRFLYLNPGTNGYRYVNLRGGERYRENVQHLVARAFITNDDPIKKRVLRHINDDKTDNRVENLEWGTYADNAMDARRNGRVTMDMYRSAAAKAAIANRRPVRLTDNKTGDLFDFDSCAQAARYLGVHPSHISMALHGRFDSVRGHRVEYIGR